MPQIHVASDQSGWIQMAAQFIVNQGRDSLQSDQRFILALSGGSTPRPVYEALPEIWSEMGLVWERVHILWSDERCVPLDHPQSNYRMAREAFIDRINIPEENVHPMNGSDEPNTGATAYEATLRKLFPDAAWPSIDLMLLGLGTDGHTASLFPGTSALENLEHWVVPTRPSEVEHWRLTFTLPAINASKTIAFLVNGSEKSGIVHEIINHDEGDPTFPAQRVTPINGQLHWLLDADAAKLLQA